MDLKNKKSSGPSLTGSDDKSIRIGSRALAWLRRERCPVRELGDAQESFPLSSAQPQKRKATFPTSLTAWSDQREGRIVLRLLLG